MPTYYDALNDFHRRNATQPLHSAAQLLYLHLLHMNNCLGNRGQVKATDRQLEELLRVTRPTITQAKRQLKNAGLIDFESPKSPRTGTLYRLPFFTATDFSQNPKANAAIFSQSLSQNLSQSVSQTGQFPITRTRETLETKSQSIGRSARTCTVDVENSLVKLWLDNRGAGVTAELLSYLRLWVTRHGERFVIELIKEAAEALRSDRMSLRYLRGCYDVKIKGGCKIDKVKPARPKQDDEYAVPDTRFDAEFS